MKFLCDRCKTRYAIADERVRGKILKIRCKSCSAVITVREGMDEAAEPTTSTPPPVPESAPEPPAPAALDEEWYVSRDGNQEGPFTLTEAQAWIAARAGGDELFCWNEGFDDWLPVEKVSHFRGLRGTPRTRPATRPGAVKEPEPQPLFAATLAAIEAEVAAASAATAAKLATSAGAVQVPAAKNPAPAPWSTPAPPTGDETLDMPVSDAAQLLAGTHPAAAPSATPAVDVPARSATPAVGVPADPRAPAAPRAAAPAIPPSATPAIGVPAMPRAPAPALPRAANPAVGVPSIGRAAPTTAVAGTPVAGTPVAGTPVAGASPAMAAAAAPAAAPPTGGMRLEPAAATPPPQRSGGLPTPFGVSRTAPGVAAPPHAAPIAAAAAPTPVPPADAMPAAPIAAAAPAPGAAPAPAWSPPPPVAVARPPSARFDNGAAADAAAADEAAADEAAAAPPAPAPNFGDDDLDIGEVSRVVKLADLGRAPAAGRAAAKPRAATAGIGRGTGAVSSFGANPAGAIAPADRAGFGGDVAPAIDAGASLGAVAVARRRSPVLYIGLGLVAVAIAVAAVIVLSGGGEDTSGNETAGGNDYDNLGYRPNDPVGRRPGSNDPGTGSGPGTAAKPPDRGSGSGTGRRPGSSVVATNTVDAGTAPPGVDRSLPDLSADDVFAMSARMESGTRRCYERAMKADPFLKVSKIRATISVSAAGPVSDVTLSTMAGTQLGTCLVAAIKRWPFKPSQTGIVSEFALVFEQN